MLQKLTGNLRTLSNTEQHQHQLSGMEGSTYGASLTAWLHTTPHAVCYLRFIQQGVGLLLLHPRGGSRGYPVSSRGRRYPCFQGGREMGVGGTLFHQTRG